MDIKNSEKNNSTIDNESVGGPEDHDLYKKYDEIIKRTWPDQNLQGQSSSNENKIKDPSEPTKGS
jgi:hypothetical protein